jgi:hypothetical protein
MALPEELFEYIPEYFMRIAILLCTNKTQIPPQFLSYKIKHNEEGKVWLIPSK